MANTACPLVPVQGAVGFEEGARHTLRPAVGAGGAGVDGRTRHRSGRQAGAGSGLVLINHPCPLSSSMSARADEHSSLADPTGVFVNAFHDDSCPIGVADTAMGPHPRLG